MESYLLISFLNDFIFCPRSIYFHQLYGNTNRAVYHTTYQTAGLAAHSSLEEKRYSTRKNILQSIEVYSEKYQILGKIDIFDTEKKQLIERKKLIKHIYDGYLFQLYAQYHCLTEMGYNVQSMALYSLDDNKKYPIKLPEQNPEMQQKFEQTVLDIRNFNLEKPFTPNPNKCTRCIYNTLCDKAKC